MTSGDSTNAASAADPARQALEHLEDAVIVLAPDASVRYANPAATRLLGPARLTGGVLHWEGEQGFLMPDEQSAFPTDALPFALALAGRASRGVGLFARQVAVHLLVDATPLRTPAGALDGASFVLRDVTASCRRETELRAALHQRRAILDNILDLAWLKDREGRFVEVNHRHEELYARPREQWIGLTDYDVYPREVAERFRADDAEVIRSRTRRVVEECVHDAGGVAHWMETIKLPVFDEHGEVIGTTGTARDITERKRIAQALVESNEALERRVAERTQELLTAQQALVRQERLAVLGQLAGGVAHQIRSPLAVIANAVALLERRIAPDATPDTADALRILQDEIRHANVIVSGLLDYARVRAPERRLVAPAELIERALVSAEVPSGIRIERAMDEAPVMQLDADQIHGALANLVRNAIDAMPDGGTLRIELSTRPDALVMAVADSGPGVRPEVAAHLFEPLHSTKAHGIGLGLVTARTFIEAHGGSLVLVPSAMGARFEIRLPR